jgi:hypothetical protein
MAMIEKSRTRIPEILLVLVFFGAIPVFGHSDRIITHLVDGLSPDGTGYRTKIDVVNLGPWRADGSLTLKNTRIYFYQENGQPWSLTTNLGAGNQFPLDLQSAATLRIETLAKGALAGGYAVVRSLEQTTAYAEDLDIGITAYYEVITAGKVVDTVSVPIGQPTVSCVFPAQNNAPENMLTGLAVLNLAEAANTLKIQLVDANGKGRGEPVNLTLDAAAGVNSRVKRALFLNQLFPGSDSFKGSVYLTASGPVSVLVLLQSQINLQTGTLLQYATLVPSYLDTLRTNTFMYLPQGFPLDADIPVVDYTNNTGDPTPWDLVYSSSRRLTVQPGAAVAPIGMAAKDNAFFDKTLTQEYLRGLPYSQNTIDLTYVGIGYGFAVRTGLGRYVKVRVADVIRVGYPDGTVLQDLALEVYVYR